MEGKLNLRKPTSLTITQTSDNITPTQANKRNTINTTSEKLLALTTTGH